MLREDVAGFEIGREENVGVTCHRRLDAFCLGGLCADGVVKREWSIENCALDLAAFGHLAKRCGIERRGHF